MCLSCIVIAVAIKLVKTEARKGASWKTILLGYEARTVMIIMASSSSPFTTG